MVNDFKIIPIQIFKISFNKNNQNTLKEQRRNNPKRSFVKFSVIIESVWFVVGECAHLCLLVVYHSCCSLFVTEYILCCWMISKGDVIFSASRKNNGHFRFNCSYLSVYAVNWVNISIVTPQLITCILHIKLCCFLFSILLTVVGKCRVSYPASSLTCWQACLSQVSCL